MSVLSVSLILAACDQEAQDEAQDDQTEEAAPADDAGEESSTTKQVKKKAATKKLMVKKKLATKQPVTLTTQAHLTLQLVKMGPVLVQPLLKSLD